MLQTGIQSCEVLNRKIVFRGEERMSGGPHYQFVARYMFVFLVVAAITASDQATGAQNISAQSKPASRWFAWANLRGARGSRTMAIFSLPGCSAFLTVCTRQESKPSSARRLIPFPRGFIRSIPRLLLLITAPHLR